MRAAFPPRSLGAPSSRLIARQETARRPCARWPAAPAEWLAGHCPRGCAVPGLDRERRSVPGAGSRPRAAAATRRWPCSGNRKCNARPWGSGGQRPGPGSTTSRRARPGSRWRRAASSVSLASRPNRLPRCGSGFAAVPGCEAEQPADRAAGIGVVTADRAGARSAVQQPGHAGSAASIRCSAAAIALRTETRARSPSELNRRAGHRARPPRRPRREQGAAYDGPTRPCRYA